MQKGMPFVALALALLLTSCAQAVVPPAPTAVPPAPTAIPSTATSEPLAQADDDVYAQFEAELEYLRQQLKIPGFSAAIVKDQELVWARGFGYADLENKVEATPDTPYRLASVTKPIAATLLMQLVEEGMLDLDEPVAKYGVELESEGVIQVWHLLTHTSEGVPGTHHSYHGHRYGQLGLVIEGVSGKSFAALLSERILEPLNMTDTAPSYSACVLENLLASPEIDERERNDAQVNRELAKPYQLDYSYDIVQGACFSGFSPAAGLVSTVTDLARFDIALDQGLLLGEETKAQMFEPAFSTYGNRTDLMYGLGWYSQQYKGTRLLWHSGRWAPSVSALYLKAPDENLTFIILANTANLTTPFPLGDGDVLYSTLAQTFYKTFVFPQQVGKTVPQVDWEAGPRDLANQLTQVTDADVREVLERELWSPRQLFASVGRKDLANRLHGVHLQAYGASPTNDLDLHAVRGGEYHPVVQARVELDEAELARLVGKYVLGDSPQGEGAALPAEVSVETKHGKLFAVDPDGGCISLIPIAPARFAIPEDPELSVEFHIDGDRAEKLTVKAGRITAMYKPGE